MKTRHALSTSAFLTALVLASVGLVSAAALARAAVAANALLPSATVVAISGTVTGSPESVVFTGPVEVSTRPAAGRIAGARAHVVVTIDLRQLSGRGLSTGTAYVSPGQANLTRVFGPSDWIELSFPFFPSGGLPGSPARTGVLTFALAYDVTTGALTAAVATVAAPNLPN
jgi:hypothetical protein